MKQALPPGPRSPSLIQGVGHWTRPLAYLERLRARFGKRFTIRLPGTPAFVIHTEPEHIKEIYTAPPDVLRPGEGGAVLEPLVGRKSVILLDEGEHMEQRKLMLPAFHGEKMAALTNLVREVTEQDVASWGADAGTLHPRSQALTLEVILRAVFGLDPGPRLERLRSSLSKLLAYGESPITLIPPPPDRDKMAQNLARLNRLGPLKGFLDVRMEVQRLIAEQIDERRESSEDRDDVLAMLLEARHEDDSPMTDEELHDELMTLLVAGHETTASSLAWGFERLAREPAVRAHLAEEVLDTDDGPYLQATINEILRDRPVLPNTLPRFVKKPVEVGGWHYEPGVNLVANAYLTHHDADIYPEPYAFRPERFLDTKPGTYTFIPFGGGRRRCLGASFAQLELRVVLAAVLRRYELEQGPGGAEVARRRNISVYPSAGSSVTLGERARVPAAA